MAVTSYIEKEQVFWQVYINLRSTVNDTIRLQKRIRGLSNEIAAQTEEKKLLKELTKQLTRLESAGANWEQVIDKWEYDKLTYRMDDYVDTTITDYAQMLRNWTKLWFGRPASELNRGDGREILRLAQEMGKPTTFVRRLKNTINQIYVWGIEERLITDVHHSPVYGIDLGKEKESKLPEIYTKEEAQLLITKACEHQHPWAPVWKGALITGMRSGELQALPWENVKMIPIEEARFQDSLPPEQRRYGLIRVHRTFNGRLKGPDKFGPTKGGYWRTIPISTELYWFLNDLKTQTGNTEFVFPRFWEWAKGQQAAVLRKFCLSVGLKSIKFHTLRAIFATLLISNGVAPTRVMKICGWKDLKTMQRYIRMAGIDEQGATEGLNLLPVSWPTPTVTPPAQRLKAAGAEHYDARNGDKTSDELADNQVMNHVVSLLDFKARR